MQEHSLQWGPRRAERAGRKELTVSEGFTARQALG